MELLKKIIKKIQDGTLREVMRELHWIYQYGLKYKGSILWYIFLGVFGIATGLAGSVISKYIIDAVTGYDSTGLVPAAVAYVLLQLFTIGSRAWTSLISEKIVIKVDQEIRADVYDKIMDADWEALSQFHSGDLLNRVDNDVSTVSGSVLRWVPDLVTRLLQFTGTLGVILYFDPTLALLSLISAPVTLIVSRSIANRIHNYNKKIRKVSSDVMVFNEESFQNVQLIKAFGLAELYKKKLRNVQETYKKIRLDYNRFHVTTSSGMSLVGNVVTMACFGWGVYRLWTGHITYGTMTLFLQLATTLSGSFSALVHMVPSAISAATAAGRLMSVTRLPKEKHLCKVKAKELIQSKKGIEVRADEISFQYDTGKKVLQKASFVAKPGEIVAIVGPSGEGKTTMLRILLGLVSAWEGSVTVNAFGEESIPVSAATRGLFAYVPQDNVMFAGTIAENLRVMKEDATDEEIYQAAERVSADEVVNKLENGYDSDVGESGGRLSTGEKQLISFARAILSNPSIFVLDEATSSIDTATEQLIQKATEELLKGHTSFVIAHRLSTIRNADVILVVKDGKIIEQGTHKELLAQKGYYHDLYYKQFEEESAMKIFAGQQEA